MGKILITKNFKQKKDMEGRSYNFSTAKVRSTLMDTKTIPFAREDENSPRMKILAKECDTEHSIFMKCLADNAGAESKCADLKDALYKCGQPVFRKVNND